MKLFIHARVTLEYFYLQKESKFKRFDVYFHCFSDNCYRVTAGGNEIDLHLSRHDNSVV